MIHHLLNHEVEYIHWDGEQLAEQIYKKAQEIINNQFNTVADWNKKITQVDLFKIWHYDNKAKLTSLKALEVALCLPNVEDMPFSHEKRITTLEEIDQILAYNKNDVFATNQFLDVTLGKTNLPLYKGKNKIELRQSIQNKFKLKCLNFNDIKLGTELILKLYCEKFKFNIKEIRKLRTPRELINLKDCLPKWMEFKTNKFNKLITHFSTGKIINGVTKDVMSTSVIYNGIKIDYGTGGAHACIKSGVYVSDDNYVIDDVDIDSLYPSLGITQGLYPEHLGNKFIDIYDGEIVSVRLSEKKKPKNERDFVIVEGFKLAANGSYGKTNEADSWLYDPMYTLKTTISGQIFISMWAEYICENIPDCTILQINTDGITFRYLKQHQELFVRLCDEITKKCSLTYEINRYSKMVIRDVNNYSAQYMVDNKIKHKGALEIDKELHKDPSMRIVPIALEQYFFYGIPIEQTIKNHKNIYDFCMRLKVDSRFIPEYHYLDVDKLKIKNLSKTTRYFISKSGGTLYKRTVESNKRTGVNVGWVTTIFNNYYELPMEEYNINYQYYIAEAYKIINQIEDNQLSLSF